MATVIKLDEDLERRVRTLAGKQESSAERIMREAILQYVERAEARADFLAEAYESWTEFHATGQHLTGEEVGEWLRTWGTPTVTAAPKCHD